MSILEFHLICWMLCQKTKFIYYIFYLYARIRKKSMSDNVWFERLALFICNFNTYVEEIIFQCNISNLSQAYTTQVK